MNHVAQLSKRISRDVEWWSQIWQCFCVSGFFFFLLFFLAVLRTRFIYVCDLHSFTNLKLLKGGVVRRVLSDTRVKRLYFLEWREVPEL